MKLCRLYKAGRLDSDQAWQQDSAFIACQQGPCLCLSWTQKAGVALLAAGTTEGAKVIHKQRQCMLAVLWFICLSDCQFLQARMYSDLGSCDDVPPWLSSSRMHMKCSRLLQCIRTSVHMHA